MRELVLGILIRYYWNYKSYNCEPELELMELKMNLSTFYNNRGEKMFYLEQGRSAGVGSYQSLFVGYDDFVNREIHESH